VYDACGSRLTQEAASELLGINVGAFQRWAERFEAEGDDGLLNLAEAIRYAHSRWQGLTRFIDDGRIELDNNTVEPSIRGIKLWRMNALFAGSDRGAERRGLRTTLTMKRQVDRLVETAFFDRMSNSGARNRTATARIERHQNA